FGTLLRPQAQCRARRWHLAFFVNPSVSGLHAVADAFLVDIESDIVIGVHWVLLIEVSEPAPQSRSRHHNLRENPFPSQPLYIQTDAFYPALFSPKQAFAAHRFLPADSPVLLDSPAPEP